MAAFITAILYTFCLYRLQDLYDRSALSEAFSFTFVPLAFWGLYEIIKGDYKKWYIISIGFCLLIFTHVIATLLVFITSIIIIIIYYKDLRQEPKRLLYLILSGMVCVLLSAYFLFPFFEQISSNSFYFEEGRMFAINFGRAKDDLIRIPTQNVLVGMLSIALPKITNLHFLPAIGLTLTFGIFLRFFIHEKDQKIKSIDIFVVLALVYIAFSFDTLPSFFYVKKFFSTIQFTWRLYEISSFFLALAGGYYLSLLLQKNIRSVAALICLLGCVVLLITVNSTYYKYTREKPKTISSQNIIIDKNSIAGLGLAEYLPIKVPSIEFIQDRNILLKTNNIETVTNNFERKNRATIFNVIVNKPDIIELPLIYYKGYSAKLNNEQITITESENGLIEIPINQSGKVHVEFTGTLIQKYSFYVTVISILLFCIYIFWYNRKNKNINKTNHVNTII
ncbi:glycosyltransferase family protein [Dysgonomonas alginatilytica]|nr:YfhO family protein [Dysgonomonas alginatilytica]